MEYIDIFDENNNPTGQIKEKGKAHEEGDFHRTAHVWIINDKNELLLQKRSANKKSHPNCWDISGAGHIKAGESVIDGAIRELKEELGVEAGGKAFLAHPFEYKFEDTIGFIDDLRKEAELDGIECFHPSSADDNKKDILVNYARKNNLYISGGSDYHGSPKPDIEVGVGRGNLNISKEIIEEWIR